MHFILSHVTFPGTSQRILRVDFDTSTFEQQDMLRLPHHPRLANAVAKRQAEHLAGRMAACEALRLHGVEDFIPGIGAHREPCWPPGFIGSITHTEQIALATVMPLGDNEHCGIGIDCETIINEQSAQDLADGIINKTERALLQSCSLPFCVALTLAFSAKESLFKALYRHVGEYFDFSAAEVTRIESQKLELVLVTQLGPFPASKKFIVLWNSDSVRLTTLIQHG